MTDDQIKDLARETVHASYPSSFADMAELNRRAQMLPSEAEPILIDYLVNGSEDEQDMAMFALRGRGYYAYTREEGGFIVFDLREPGKEETRVIVPARPRPKPESMV